MLCENKFCMYQEKNSCTLETITLNRLGICMECILVSISEEHLEKEKIRQLKRYDDDLAELERIISKNP